MKHSEQFTAIAAALAVAAGKFAPIQKNRTVEVKTKNGGSYTFTYATLDAIVAAVRPSLSENGLVLVQSVITEEITVSEPDGVRIVREDMLETRLVHSSGEWFANATPVLVATDENSAQAYGSAITYARRYGITQLLCVVADEDDDGNAASGNVSRSKSAGSARGNSAGGAPISEKQVGMLRAKLKAIKGDEAALCVFLQVDALEALPKGQMDKALAAIETQEPAILQGAMGSGSKGDAAQQAARKKAHDDAVADNFESLQLIRYHLGEVRTPEVEVAAADMDLGDRNPARAAAEWREFSEAEQQALWLAPTKGGWFTTDERDALRDILTANPKA